jgi:hypothetical protein
MLVLYDTGTSAEVLTVGPRLPTGPCGSWFSGCAITLLADGVGSARVTTSVSPAAASGYDTWLLAT